MHFGGRQVALGVVGEFTVRFGEAAFVVVAQDSPVGEAAAAGESAEGEQLDHTKTLQCN